MLLFGTCPVLLSRPPPSFKNIGGSSGLILYSLFNNKKCILSLYNSLLEIYCHFFLNKKGSKLKIVEVTYFKSFSFFLQRRWIKAVVGISSGKAMIIAAQFIRTNWFLCGILILICFASIAPSIGARGGRKSIYISKQLISSNITK